MALRGWINTALTAELTALDVPALGLCGADLGLLRATFLNHEDLGWVGGPPRVDAHRLRGLLAQGVVPVIAPICQGPEGALLNVNADTVTHAIAVALSPCDLDFLSDAPGLRDAQGTLLSQLRPPEVAAALASAQVRGSLIPKLQAAVSAVASGVLRVRIGDLSSLDQGTATEVLP